MYTMVAFLFERRQLLVQLMVNFLQFLAGRGCGGNIGQCVSARKDAGKQKPGMAGFGFRWHTSSRVIVGPSNRSDRLPTKMIAMEPSQRTPPPKNN
jgi:hypothetical protein